MFACGKYALLHIAPFGFSATEMMRPSLMSSVPAVCFALSFAATSAMSRTFFLSSGRSLRRNALVIAVTPASEPASISVLILPKSRVVAVTVICAR